ncbi:MAG: AEC family transporter [Clostridia bacterium]|nr:AEC family transporter [Clostridia bacterium]
MLNSFIYSFNSVMPLVLLVVCGMFLKKIKFLDGRFCDIADKLVFNVALPMESVKSLSQEDFGVIFSSENLRVNLFFFVGIVVAFVILCVCVVYGLKSNPQRSVFVQGAVRGNYAIFALPLAGNMFSDAGTRAAIMLLPVVIIMYNFLAVIAFSIFAPSDDEKKTVGQIIWRIAKSTVKNPLIVSILVALALSFLRSETGVEMPEFMMSTVGKIAALAVPLSLISIGVSFNPATLKNGLGIAICCGIVKNIALPAVALTVGILMGFRGIPLTMILLSFGGPTAVSSYIMAKNMHGDGELASKILVLTTICSLGTMFMFIFLLKHFAFI